MAPEEQKSSQGIPVVLTADRILMADYPILLDGMLSASTTNAPGFLMRSLLAPPLHQLNGQAPKAPLGLRRVEAALRAGGMTEADTAVVIPSKITEAIGPATRAVLVSCGDPLGLGMNNSTMSGIGGGKPFTPRWFGDLMRELRVLKQQYGFRIIFGGPGAWQLEHNEEACREFGIDTLFCGYCEKDIAACVRSVMNDDETASVMQGVFPPSEDIPAILGPTIMGVVEVSRGCGLGCGFCTMQDIPQQHIPVDRVVADVITNVEGGQSSVCLISEDILRYGGKAGELVPEKVLELAEKVRAVEGLRMIQLDHLNVSSAARFPEDALKQLFETLTRGTRHNLLWVNLGVESLSGRLIRSSGCAGKLHPFQPEEWEGACREAVERLMRAGFMPMISLVFGLPGETTEDLELTLKFVESLRGQRVTVFPLFYAPLTPEEKAFTVTDMTALHWRIFRKSYRLNFKWIPRMYGDNYRAAGVSLMKRTLIQLGGLAKRLEWELRFIFKSGRLRP